MSAAAAVGAVPITAATDGAADGAEEMLEIPSVTYNDALPKPMWAETADRQGSWMELILALLGGLRGPIIREASTLLTRIARGGMRLFLPHIRCPASARAALPSKQTIIA